MKITFKWQPKKPNPDVLKALPEKIREGVLDVVKSEVPGIIAQLVARVKSGKGAVGGKDIPIPPYSKNYARRKRRAGFSDKPNLTLSGTLLASLKGAIKPHRDLIEVTVAPSGRVADPRHLLKSKGVEIKIVNGKYFKPPYSYTNKKGATVQVPGQWVKVAVSKESAKAKAAEKKPIYNAHLANLLATRMGGGRWGGGKAKFISLTEAEMETLQGRVKDRVAAVLAKGLKDVVGS